MFKTNALVLALFFVVSSMSVRAEDAPLRKIESPSVPAVEVSVLNENEANDLFRTVWNDTSIPYSYRVDGCYARATAMSRIAESQKIIMGKVFAEGNLKANPELPESQNPVNWGWHVAPVVYVKDAKGMPKLMVFDPSLSNKPVSIDQWKSLITLDGSPASDIKSFYFRPRFDQWPKKTQPTEYKKWEPSVLANTDYTLQLYKDYAEASRQIPEFDNSIQNQITQ